MCTARLCIEKGLGFAVQRCVSVVGSSDVANMSILLCHGQPVFSKNFDRSIFQCVL